MSTAWWVCATLAIGCGGSLSIRRGPDVRAADRKADDCELSGSSAPELFDPVVAYARAHLVRDFQWPIPADAPVGTDHLDRPASSHPDGVSIQIDARSERGRLHVVFYYHEANADQERRETRYCLAVARDGRSRVVTVSYYGALWTSTMMTRR